VVQLGSYSIVPTDCQYAADLCRRRLN